MEVKPYIYTAQICVLEDVLLLNHETYTPTLQYILVISSVRAVSKFQTFLVQSEIVFAHFRTFQKFIHGRKINTRYQLFSPFI